MSAAPTPTPPPTAGDGATAAEILRQRARRLAQTTVTISAHVEALVCRVAGERCAIELGDLRAVHRAAGITPIPGVPPFVAGLINVRGQIVAVLDLGAALDLPPAVATTAAGPGGPGGPAGEATRSQVLLVDRPGSDREQVGLLVDEILGVEPLALDTLSEPLSEDPTVRGVVAAAGGSTVVLSVATLLASGRFDIFQEIH